MRKKIDLLKGPIFPSLIKLAVPITATSFIQMAYNLTDMLWIGHVGSNAVAAVGAAGMYSWLSNGFSTMARIGAQVKVAHSMGEKQFEHAADYAKSALFLGALFGVLYGFISILFSRSLISFFRLNSPEVISDASVYLAITCGAIVFNFLNQILTGILTAMGNSSMPFLATTCGLVLNILFDPLLIFGAGPIPAMGVTGAAIATVGAQIVVFLVFLLYILKEPVLFSKIHYFSLPSFPHVMEVVRLGLPQAVQSVVFTGISMIIARLIAGWGDAAVAVQKVGSQIESISWMTADGFSSAVNSFVAQNFGARNEKRVKKGYSTAMGVVLLWGLFCTVLLVFFPEPIFRIFIREENVIPMGVDYLRILGYSQLLMCVEITTCGAFCGLGRTMPPSIVSIIFTAVRIPMAYLLSSTLLGLNGVWWSITLSSIAKGCLLFVWFAFTIRKLDFSSPGSPNIPTGRRSPSR